ncbi:MAG: class I SAM-dependent DNA methyltransferase [Solirubrobacteraceae bacterium]
MTRAESRSEAPAPQRPRVGPEFFEDLYAHDEDPWGFARRDYEREKYRHTLAALGDARFARGLEVGCSIGVLTEQLATVCHELVGIDVSARALALAQRRLGGAAGVSVRRMSFPEQMPDGHWDLVVCSEVLYYLDPPAFARALERLAAVLDGGGAVLAVHWRPATSTYPLRGDEVHDRMLAALGGAHVLDDRRPRYRLDLLQGR